jgi:hypothetical protein
MVSFESPLIPTRFRSNAPPRDNSASAARPLILNNLEVVGRWIDSSTVSPAQAVFDVLDGKVAGVHIQNVLSRPYCAEVAQRFEVNPQRQPRKDGVPAFEIGVTQYGKSGEQLARLARQQQGLIREVAGAYADNEIALLWESIARVGGQRGQRVRPACFLAEPMLPYRFVGWVAEPDERSMLLRFHDDVAQIRTSKVTEFEISEAVSLVAINLYLRATPGSGQLVVYDWRPTPSDRRRFGVELTGYPYPEDAIPANARRHVFELTTGDAVILDGSYVHGVMIGHGVAGRIVCNGFAALLPDGTVALFA